MVCFLLVNYYSGIVICCRFQADSQSKIAPCSGYPDAVEERVAQTGSELQV
jgi:hypothetical protein